MLMLVKQVTVCDGSKLEKFPGELMLLAATQEVTRRYGNMFATIGWRAGDQGHVSASADDSMNQAVVGIDLSTIDQCRPKVRQRYDGVVKQALRVSFSRRRMMPFIATQDFDQDGCSKCIGWTEVEEPPLLCLLINVD